MWFGVSKLAQIRLTLPDHCDMIFTQFRSYDRTICFFIGQAFSQIAHVNNGEQ